MASLHSEYGTIAGEDRFNKLKEKNAFACCNLHWTNLSCLTVDAGKNMSGIKKDLVGQMKHICNEKNIPQPMFIHCIIHHRRARIAQLGIDEKPPKFGLRSLNEKYPTPKLRIFLVPYLETSVLYILHLFDILMLVDIVKLDEFVF
ncbi:uncharacterized protein NPIL_132461 [Nephila pilipes]|uniref:Uncharacterized protein n=1 Tax=Nephila pilipes TaxID=299642 RepID=A0A8X6MFW1_NEPPI|nr:uncharacterized protein NPIL_132461 [Nephila pilipes]